MTSRELDRHSYLTSTNHDDEFTAGSISVFRFDLCSFFSRLSRLERTEAVERLEHFERYSLDVFSLDVFSAFRLTARTGAYVKARRLSAKQARFSTAYQVLTPSRPSQEVRCRCRLATQFGLTQRREQRYRCRVHRG